MALEPDRRSNFFFSPPACLFAVTYMTEISLDCDVKQPTQLNSNSTVPCRCLDDPTKCLCRWEPEHRSNYFFFGPPAHLRGVACMAEISLIVTLNNQFTSIHLKTYTKQMIGKEDGVTCWIAIVTQTDRPDSVRNSCVIEVFGSVYCVDTIFYVGIGTFFIELSQISSFFSLWNTDKFDATTQVMFFFLFEPPINLMLRLK